MLPFNVELRGIGNIVGKGIMAIYGQIHGAASRGEMNGFRFTPHRPVCRQGIVQFTGAPGIQHIDICPALVRHVYEKSGIF